MTVHQYNLRYVKAEHFTGYDRPSGALYDMAMFCVERRVEPTDVSLHYDLQSETFTGTIYYEDVR